MRRARVESEGERAGARSSPVQHDGSVDRRRGPDRTGSVIRHLKQRASHRHVYRFSSRSPIYQVKQAMSMALSGCRDYLGTSAPSQSRCRLTAARARPGRSASGASPLPGRRRRLRGWPGRSGRNCPGQRSSCITPMKTSIEIWPMSRSLRQSRC